MSEDWKWQAFDSKESIVLPSTRAIAIYTNSDGDIVIRQEGDGHGDQPGDDVIVVPRKGVNAVVKALRDEVGKPFVPE